MPDETAEHWADVAAVTDLAATGRHVYDVDGHSILLCRTGGEIVAVSTRCTHLGESLAKGRIMGGQIYCPHHSACFDLRTGEAVSGPAVTRLPRYPVRVEEGRVWVRLDEVQPALSAGARLFGPAPGVQRPESAGEAPSAAGQVHKITVDPAGAVIGVRPGEPVLSAAFREGYRWPSVCGGEAMCGTCFVKVTDGPEHTSPVGDAELVRLKHIGRAGDPTIRLACQLTLSGDVAVFKRGVRKLEG